MSSTVSSPFVLPVQLKTDAAEELRAKLLSEGELICELDAGDVAFIGFAGVQVLLAAAKSAQRDRRSLKIVNASDAFLQSLGWLGVGISELESEGEQRVH